jgi:imidazolonepropionase-like amidohydrolase
MIIIKNAKILTMTGSDYDCADVIVDNGKIAAIGENLAVETAERIIDATGLTLIPGIIDPHSHIGMWEDGMGDEGADGNEDVDPCTPQLRAIDGINPVDRSFEEARNHGITTVATGPGSANVISGQFVALKTKHTYVIEEMIVKEPLALKIAFGENPKRVYKERDESPVTRMGMAAMLRQQLIEGQEYIKALEEGESDPDKIPDRDLGKEIIAKALKREIIVKAHAHRADDILTAIRIAKEFNLKLSIEHCTEGYLIADVLKKEDVTIIVGPLFSERCKVELKNLTFEAPRILSEAGIQVAMMTDHPVIPTQYLPLCAGIAVREGLDEYEALRMITKYAAKAIGLEDRIGTIEVGKDADMVLFNGHPFDTRSRVQYVLIDGEVVKGN